MNGASATAEKKNPVAEAWLRALELTAAIPRNPNRTMPVVIEELADRRGDAPALLSDGACMSYRELAARKNQYARWALDQNIQKNDVVCLLMPNCPEYMAIWLGIGSIGGVTALLNTNLTGVSLSHCINAVSPKHIIASAEFAEAMTAVLPELSTKPTVWTCGWSDESFRNLDRVIAPMPIGGLSADERRQISIADRALCIFTSGTSGLPKAANVSHARILQWSYWFSGMLGIEPSDRLYICLPMYHSIGGVLAPGAALAGGGSVVIRDKFSASRFWRDIIRWECTIFQYIGELCRYLLHGTSAADAAGHQVRVACGNGMAADVWSDFKDKFNIPKVLEFYASTEGGVSLFNVEEKPGSIGRVPPYLRQRFSPELIKVDVDSCDPVRDESGLCMRCGANEVGEAIGRIIHDPSAVGTRFEGYTDEQASSGKILRDVIKPGDAWIRTGDLMRRDGMGFYYFVDRLGDTFRWKGENVASTEVSRVICAYPGVKHANVYGVRIPSADGRAGMAALVADPEIDLKLFRAYLRTCLPSYARPVFVRLRTEMDINGNFKYTKGALTRQGYDPSTVAEPIYFDDPERHEFVRVDAEVFERIHKGGIRL